MELIAYLQIVRRWLWLLLLMAFIGGSAAYIINSGQPPVYRAQSTVMIGTVLESSNPNPNDFYLGTDLAFTYSQLVYTREVLQAAINALGIELTPEALKSMVSTAPVEYTSLLTISVTDYDPIQATDLANELAHQLALEGPSSTIASQQEQIQLLTDQLNIQIGEVSKLREQLASIDGQLADAIDPETRENLAEQRTIVMNQVNSTSSNIAWYTETISTLQQHSNTVEVVEEAIIPGPSYGVDPLSKAMLGATILAGLTFGGILLYEYLNTTFHNSEDLAQAIQLPILGVISKYGKRQDLYTGRLLVNMPSTAHPVEEYHTTRMNLQLSGGIQQKIFVITSAIPKEGKSLTSANLAISLALAGQRVLLIDADLRQPKLHRAFSLENQLGLSTLLKSPTAYTDHDTIHTTDNIDWFDMIQETPVANLSIMTSGISPSDPAILLGSLPMQNVIEQIRENRSFDVVIIDTPPVLAVSDSVLMAGTFDLETILVVRAGYTRVDHVNRTIKRLKQVGVSISGVILNQSNLREDSYYGDEYDYYAPPQSGSKPLL